MGQGAQVAHISQVTTPTVLEVFLHPGVFSQTAAGSSVNNFAAISGNTDRFLASSVSRLGSHCYRTCSRHECASLATASASSYKPANH